MQRQLGGRGILFYPRTVFGRGMADSGVDWANVMTWLEIVPRKHLTSNTNWGTVNKVGRIDMANVLNTDKKIAVIAALAEGSSIRSIERVTVLHVPPAVSSETAVRVVIAQELRANAEAAEA
jgi:hypothetical protein